MASVDITKILLSLCVVLLHTHGLVLGFHPSISVFNKVVSNLAVPLFLVFSGYFFHKSCNKKPLKKVLYDNTLRLIALSLIYQTTWILFLNDNGSALQQLVSSDAKLSLITGWLYQLFVDGSYQFWYITSLVFCLWIVGIGHKYHKNGLVFAISLGIYCILILTSTWSGNVNLPFLNNIVDCFVPYFTNIYQSFFIALIFVSIGFNFEKIYAFMARHKFLVVVFTLIYLGEACFGLRQNVDSLSLWLSSPLMCVALFSGLRKYPTHISQTLARTLRHTSTVIYCIHYQLAVYFVSGIENILEMNRELLFAQYLIMLFVLTAAIVIIAHHLSKRSKFFTYFY